MPLPISSGMYRITQLDGSFSGPAFGLLRAVRDASKANMPLQGFSLQESFSATLEELKAKEYTLLADIHESMNALKTRLRDEGMDKVRNMLTRINAMDEARRKQLAEIVLPGDEESATRALMQEVKAREAKVNLLETLSRQLRAVRFRPAKQQSATASAAQSAASRRRSSRVQPAGVPTTVDFASAARALVGAASKITKIAAEPLDMPVTTQDPISAAMNAFGIDMDHTKHIAKKRENLSVEQKAIFKEWFVAHLAHPYPSEPEKRELAAAAGTTVERVTNWCVSLNYKCRAVTV